MHTAAVAVRAGGLRVIRGAISTAARMIATRAWTLRRARLVCAPSPTSVRGRGSSCAARGVRATAGSASDRSGPRRHSPDQRNPSLQLRFGIATPLRPQSAEGGLRVFRGAVSTAGRTPPDEPNLPSEPNGSPSPACGRGGWGERAASACAAPDRTPATPSPPQSRKRAPESPARASSSVHPLAVLRFFLARNGIAGDRIRLGRELLDQ